MDRKDQRNVQRVLRRMAAEQRVPVWLLKRVIQQGIDQTWEQADPEHAALLARYFPEGKPDAEEYILRLGRAHETGEQIPYLLR